MNFRLSLIKINVTKPVFPLDSLNIVSLHFINITKTIVDTLSCTMSLDTACTIHYYVRLTLSTTMAVFYKKRVNVLFSTCVGVL